MTCAGGKCFQALGIKPISWKCRFDTHSSKACAFPLNALSAHHSGYIQPIALHWCKTGFGRPRPIFVCQCGYGARRLFFRHGHLPCKTCHNFAEVRSSRPQAPQSLQAAPRTRRHPRHHSTTANKAQINAPEDLPAHPERNPNPRSPSQDKTL